MLFRSTLNIKGKLENNAELITDYFAMGSSEIGLNIKIRSRYNINDTNYISDFTESYRIFKGTWTTLFP